MSAVADEDVAILQRHGAREARVHDPSTIVKCGGEYWLFGTGMGVSSWRSGDLEHWEPGPRIFEEPPAWITDIVPTQRGHFWAPDIIHHNGRYLLYYSVSTFGKQTSAIALATNPTLDPDSPAYCWTDQGVVVRSSADDDFNAIDPSVFEAADGSLWLVFGSFWSGIKLVELDPETGLRGDVTVPPLAIAHKQEIEAPALYARGGWYYLFVNWGICCRGVRSTYEVRVGRSREITGPYLDRDGVDLLQGGGSLVLASDGPFIGPGHAGLLEEGERTWFSCHFYDATNRGRSRLALQPLGWDAEGWPVVEPAESHGQAAAAGAGAEQRPWARWWWLGSAVDKANLTARLTQYRDAGFGGVEICPIYGVHGWEDRQKPFLSETWMEMLAHTMREAKRLGLGIDLTTGTGWPFGGPWVKGDEGSAKLVLKRFDLEGGSTAKVELPKGRLDCARAVSDQGEQRDLTALAKDGRIEWNVPQNGGWKLYVALAQGPVQKVKRAAPGGEGWVLDPYSTNALSHYLARFDQAFRGYDAPMPRAHFHDSFEYYGAQWTPGIFETFRTRHDYDLRDHLPELLSEGLEDAVARVKHDYRDTLAAMHQDYVRAWTDWAHGYGSLTRNQAHGAPANLIDLYATVDIPETEIFGAIEEKYIPMQQLASSAAHDTGRRLVSAESFTWLNDHFQTSLADLKQAADYLFLSGVNHLVYHGIPYSPLEVPWPGWQFYAAVNFGPDGGLWRDLPAFNAYVTRCQSVLQSGAPANDVLLYFPFADLFMEPKGLLRTFTVHNANEWLEPHSFHAAAMTLLRRGYPYDAITDALLQRATCVDGQVVPAGGPARRVVLVPRTIFMPETTLVQLVNLARDGATILLLDALPRDVPGLGRLAERRAVLKSALDQLTFGEAQDGVSRALVGKGRFLLGDDVEALLATAGVKREPMVDAGLRFVRRRVADGMAYLVANRSDRAVDGFVPLAVPARTVRVSDPSTDAPAAVAPARHDPDGVVSVRLQLLPGESRLLWALDASGAGAPMMAQWRVAGDPVPLQGTWQVEFIDGGPDLPVSFSTQSLGSWTERDDPATHSFAGTARYTLGFDFDPGAAEGWWLDLGEVCESARVRLNGASLGTLWHPPFRIEVGAGLRTGRNRLEVEVTNLPSNRVADLDRRGVEWKYFYDANVVNKQYRPFDAADWPLADSGLLGPVTLTPLAAGTD